MAVDASIRLSMIGVATFMISSSDFWARSMWASSAGIWQDILISKPTDAPVDLECPEFYAAWVRDNALLRRKEVD
jgi:hypothetical protein